MAVLDADFLIALEQDDRAAVEWLHAHRHEEHLVPDVVVVEYLTGHTSVEQARDALDSAFRIGYTTAEWIATATRFRKELRRKGVRFRTPDFWIASWAMHLTTQVVTGNTKHFAPMGVDVVDYRDTNA